MIRVDRGIRDRALARISNDLSLMTRTPTHRENRSRMVTRCSETATNQDNHRPVWKMTFLRSVELEHSTLV